MVREAEDSGLNFKAIGNYLALRELLADSDPPGLYSQSEHLGLAGPESGYSILLRSYSDTMKFAWNDVFDGL